MALTSKEKDFCRYYAVCQNHREAAARAGYAFPDRTGLRLLARQEIQEEVDSASGSSRSPEVANGLRRIAFGSAADAVKLLTCDFPDPESLDLFMVSEIKRSANGGMEIKFFDRIRALEALSAMDDGSAAGESSQLVAAIFKGASAIHGAGSESDEI